MNQEVKSSACGRQFGEANIVSVSAVLNSRSSLVTSVPEDKAI